MQFQLVLARNRGVDQTNLYLWYSLDGLAPFDRGNTAENVVFTFRDLLLDVEWLLQLVLLGNNASRTKMS